MDISKLSNEDLLALHNKQYDKLSNEGLMALHGQNQPAPLSEPSIVEKGIDLLPGMKQRREQIAQQRSTPDYQQAHPKPITGMEDPVYTLGMGGVGPESALSLLKSSGNLLGAAGRGISNFLKPAARRSEVLNQVKNISGLEPYVAGKVNEAAEMFNKKQISPRMMEQEARLKGSGDIPNTIKLNPQDLIGVSPELDKYAISLGKDPIEIPAAEGLQLRKLLNDAAGWKQHPMDPTKAQAIDAKAAELHKGLSNQFSNIDPAMGQLSEELKNAYNSRNAVIGRNSRNPIDTVRTTDSVGGLAKRGRLSSFDEQAGSDLSGLGSDIKLINDRLRPTTLSDLFSIHGPKHIALKTFGAAPKTYDSLMTKQLAGPELTDSEKLRALLQKYSAAQGDESK